jgi:glycine/sarcosine N-methyltransferase
LRIFDCACGIGTQVLGLAARGHMVTGSDLSPAAVARAAREAQQCNLDIRFAVTDMRDLSTVAESGFDAVIAVDNALPHLVDDQDLIRTAQQIAGKLRPGGLFLASIRDYDRLVSDRPSMTPPRFFQDGEYRRICHQVWDWTSDCQYIVHLYITQEGPTGWVSRHFVFTYRALLRDELTGFLIQAGFASVRWLMPAESGFYQPVVLARLASRD